MLLKRIVASAFLAAILLQGLSLAGQIPAFGGQAAYAADLVARRAAVMSSIGPNSVLVLWSAPRRVYSADTDYEYRQDSNLLYLTGIEQPDSILVLVPGGALLPAMPGEAGGPDTEITREVLFIRAVDPDRELWDGRLLRPQEAAAQSGVQRVVPQRGTEAFDGFMASLLAKPVVPDEREGFRTALSAGRARVLTLDRATADGALPAGPDAAQRMAWGRSLQTISGVTFGSAVNVLERQRAIKTPYEQALLRESVSISTQAHLAGMRATRPGRWEYEIEAAIEFEWHRRGALSWGYPSIVASGPNATSLHYDKSTRQMASGDLLLVDAAGNYQGLTGDITRTYPVDGRFTREQRELYDLVLRAADAGIAAARPGGMPSDISRAVRSVLGPGLLELGLVTDPEAATGASPQITWWAPHSPVHGIGVDVHDPLFTLDPGAAFVVEPGLYIRSDVLERLEASPATQSVAAAIRPAVMRYLNMGVRIEDSLLMTEHGPENLSAAVPRRPEDVERAMGATP